MDSVQSNDEIVRDETDCLTNTDLLDMKNRLDDELQCLLIAQSADGQTILSAIPSREDSVTVSQESEPGDLEELQKRVYDLQEQLLEESNTCSVNELLLKRIQMGQTLCDAIFNDNTDTENNLYISRSLQELELESEIKRIQKETLELEEKLECQKMTNLQLRKENMEMMQQIQTNKEKTKSVSAEIAHNVNYKRLKKELEVKCQSVDIHKNLIQLLILGTGEDWRQNPEYSQAMLKCGEPFIL